MKKVLVLVVTSITMIWPVDHLAAANSVFTRMATQVGLASVGPSQGDMPVFAYRGSLAIVPSRHGNPWPVMVRDATGRFGPVATVLPLKEDGHGCTAADLTDPALAGPDGLVDLICTKGACHGTCTREYRKELWVQRPEGGFVNLAGAAGIAQPHARGRDTTALALPDGRVVVAFANERSSRYPAELIDRAYLVAEGVFTELPLQDASGTRRSNSAGFCVVAVPRPDALPDLLFCDGSKVNVYRHDGDRYRRTDAYGSFVARDLLVADVNGDDRMDILAVTKNRLTVRVGGTAPVTLALLGDAHGLAYGDMDCDGQADILVVQSVGAGNAHMLLLNNGGGLSYRAVPFPYPATGSGDTATYVPDWDGAGHAAMLVSNGHYTSGPTSFVTSSCN